jgi:predicted deacylase
LDWLLQVFQKCNSILDVDTDPDPAGLRHLESSLAENIDSLGDLHTRKQYPQMAFDIRQKLIPDVEKFSVYVHRLRSLSASTQ